MAVTESYYNQLITIEATIDQSADDDLTPSIDLAGYQVVALQMPSAWTAANITLEGSVDNSTFQAVYNRAGVQYTITAAASRYITIDPSDSLSFPRYIKIATSAGQAADRTITLVLRKV